MKLCKCKGFLDFFKNNMVYHAAMHKHSSEIIGIYKIVNKIDGKYYVGSSKNIKDRWRNHIKDLRRNRHHNQHLQRSWMKYGESNFDFTIIKILNNNNSILSEEQYFLDIAKNEHFKSYNSSFIAGKVDMTPETRNKIRLKTMGHNRNTGRKYSTETINKRKNSRSWYKHHTKETKLKISIKAKGRKVSDSTKLKISNSLKGNIPHNLHTVNYTFYNKIKNVVFRGTKNDFIKKFSLSKQPVYAIINKNTRLKSYLGWIVVEDNFEPIA